MANRPYLLEVDKITAAPDGVHNDGGELDGCALEIHVRNGGKSKRAYFRYNGTPFGEKRTQRIPLGSYDLGLPQLRRDRAACEQLIAQGKSPKRYREQDQEKRRAAGMTLREALEEYWKHASKKLWSPGTHKHNDGIREKHLEPMSTLLNMPIDSIRAAHLNEAIGEKWATMSGIGPRIRSLLHSTLQYQIDKDDGVYRGPNPASWRKASSLSRLLAEQLPSKPHPGLDYRDVPKVVAYFCGPMDHWVPGYLTTMQAAYAFERDPKAIREAYARGLLKGAIEAPPIWKSSSNLFPIDELKRQYGPFKREPMPHEHESARLHSRLVRFLIYTPVRAANGCGLRWRNIKVKDGREVIEYLPKRPGFPSEHKNGWKFNIPYVVILTDNLRALIEEQREQQIRDDIKIEPDGFVFVHSRPQTGADRWFGKRSTHATVDDYLTKAVARLNAAGAKIRLVPEDAKKVTVHGQRGATFTTWAKQHGYSDDLINLSLGHIIPAILENKTNWSYFYNVDLMEDRTEMMQHWERHCLSLVQPADNVLKFPASA